MTMLSPLAPPLPGGGGAFTFAAWNIRCERNAGMISAAKGLEQMGVGLAVLTETKLTDDRYTRLVSGFKILTSKATSHNQGGIALLWKENHPGYPPHVPTCYWQQAILLHGHIHPPHRHDGGRRSSGCVGSLLRGLHPPCPGRPEY